MYIKGDSIMTKILLTILCLFSLPSFATLSDAFNPFSWWDNNTTIKTNTLTDYVLIAEKEQSPSINNGPIHRFGEKPPQKWRIESTNFFTLDFETLLFEVKTLSHKSAESLDSLMKISHILIDKPYEAHKINYALSQFYKTNNDNYAAYLQAIKYLLKTLEACSTSIEDDIKALQKKANQYLTPDEERRELNQVIEYIRANPEERTYEKQVIKQWAQRDLEYCMTKMESIGRPAQKEETYIDRLKDIWTQITE
jgi:hypothetical protein